MIASVGTEPKDHPQVGMPPPAYGNPQQYAPSPMPQVGTPIIQSQPQYQLHPSEAARMGEQYRAELMAGCAVGRHDRKTTYGVCGIITAIICFPIGLIALCIDTEDRCARCGVRL